MLFSPLIISRTVATDAAASEERHGLLLSPRASGEVGTVPRNSLVSAIQSDKKKACASFSAAC
jgi:hypothetical protein